MRIYYSIRGGHVHCRVFTTGSKCGDLVSTVEEWPHVRRTYFTASVTLTEEE